MKEMHCQECDVILNDQNICQYDDEICQRCSKEIERCNVAEAAQESRMGGSL